MLRPPDQEHSRPGEQEPQPVMIFDVALDDYLAWHQQYRSATATAYAGDLLHLAHALRPVATVCSQVREEQLQAYVEQLGTVSGYGAATIARKVYVIKSFFRTLCARGLLTHNPAERLKGPVVPRSNVALPTTEEMDRLLDPARATTPQQIRDQAMWQLLCELGLRTPELMALQVEDLDLEQGLLFLRADPIEVALTRKSWQALQRYLHEARPKLSRGERDEHALFLSSQGKPLTRQGIWFRCQQDARQAGIRAHPPSHLWRGPRSLPTARERARVRAKEPFEGRRNRFTNAAGAAARGREDLRGRDDRPTAAPCKPENERGQRMAKIPTGVHLTYQQQYRTCGRSGCRTCQNGPGHGPYWYAFWREGGKVRSGYVGKVHPGDSMPPQEIGS